jgi:hypothetical protein
MCGLLMTRMSAGALHCDEQVVDEVDERRADAAGELAVREGPGPALAEEDVALRVVRPALVEGVHDAHAPLDARPALEHDGRVALAREQPRGEEAGRVRCR